MSRQKKMTVRELLKMKVKPKKKHIQICMDPQFYDKVRETLQAEGRTWQEVIHASLELYVAE